MRKTTSTNKKPQKKDVLRLIVADHDALRESIDILTSEEATMAERKRHLEKFLMNLRLHVRTEEATFYDSLVSFKSLRSTILENYEEHNIADNLAAELEAQNFSRDWTDEIEAKAKVLAELIKHHAEEEEKVLFPEVRANLTKTELENLGVVYLQKRKDIKNELEEKFAFPSVGQVSMAVQHSWKGAMNRVSSYVSNKISPSR